MPQARDPVSGRFISGGGSSFVPNAAGIANLTRSPAWRAYVEGKCIEVENTAKRLVHQSGSGRVYVRHGISHTASAPGEAPATDTGHLSDSLTHDLRTDTTGIYGRVGSNLVYARALELGDPAHNLEARPYLRPSLTANGLSLAYGPAF